MDSKDETVFTLTLDALTLNGPVINRRDFCRTTCVGLVALGIPACDVGVELPAPENDDAGTPVPDDAAAPSDLTKSANACPDNVSDAGKPPASFALNTATYIKTDKAFVCRDKDGFYVMDAQCTHEGCIVKFVNSKIAPSFACPCHGATFQYDGNVTKGPAMLPLNHYPACLLGNGNLGYDTNGTADTTDRFNP